MFVCGREGLPHTWCNCMIYIYIYIYIYNTPMYERANTCTNLIDRVNCSRLRKKPKKKKKKKKKKKGKRRSLSAREIGRRRKSEKCTEHSVQSNVS